MAERFDAVVVGAGPAGSMAALQLARAGVSVCLLERGPFPGSKNLYGGVVYARVLDGLLPGWAEEAPLERFVTRRVTMVLTATQSLAVDFRSSAWGEAPYNGATALRPEFDSWLAAQAEAAGAVLVCSTTATGLVRDGAGAVTGVVTDRPGGEIEAGVVVACDGVNAFLAKQAGLAGATDSSHYTLGVKQVLRLPEGEIEQRFGLGPGEGADYEILGGTGEVPGGGFLYTNRDTVSVGLVLSLDGLSRAEARPEELLAELTAHPAIAPLVAGGEVVEYGAHLIPEAGLEMMPRLAGDGILVAGDAAGMCLAAGIWLEGVNFAMASGAAAGEAAAEALAAGDTTERGLRGYEARLSSSFVLADHRRLRRAPGLVLSERVQRRYPEMVCNLVEEMFTVRNPAPKPGLLRLARQAARRSGVGLGDLVRDGWRAWRTFG
ncbi:MAG TPA: FAD-dependent oxidoreductase [Acidimicrobiales bacterium]|nr:FAD-dependent oxidoreductase [Acidimicrobiales bacterium]